MTERRAVVNKIIPFSSVDGPGNRTAVFLQGCNFSCQYCHNPETIGRCTQCGQCVRVCPAGALTQDEGRIVYHKEKCTGCDTCLHICPHLSSPKTREMSVAEVVAAVKRNMPFIRGVTLSGGECTCQKEFVYELLLELQKEGLSCYLDSNGSLDFAQETELLAVTDQVMLDVKAFDSTEHQSITGTDNETVKKNLAFLAKANKLFEVRTVIVPGLFDARQTLREVAGLVLPYAQRYDIRYKLIAYRSMGVREPYRSRFCSPEPETMEALKVMLQEMGWRNIVIL